MAKVFSFTSVLRKNMMEKDKPDLYYALAKSSGEIDIDEMAERIQRSSTVNWADVVCVLRALQTEMIDSFKKGEIVRLGNIGSFYVTLRSNGVLVQKDARRIAAIFVHQKGIILGFNIEVSICMPEAGNRSVKQLPELPVL